MLLLILGAYVPLTRQGNIVVDGVLTSCYPSVPHDLAHIVMLPMTWFPRMDPWRSQWISRLCHDF